MGGGVSGAARGGEGIQYVAAPPGLGCSVPAQRSAALQEQRWARDSLVLPRTAACSRVQPACLHRTTVFCSWRGVARLGVTGLPVRCVVRRRTACRTVERHAVGDVNRHTHNHIHTHTYRHRQTRCRGGRNPPRGRGGSGCSCPGSTTPRVPAPLVGRPPSPARSSL